MEELPAVLLSVISEADQRAVLDWWRGLSATDRQSVVAAYDERWEECFFGLTPDGSALPVVLGGQFVPHDDAWQFGEWEADWREYLVDHPDVPLISGMFRSSSWHTGGGVLNIWVEWSRTRFKNWELPPSEQHARE